MTKFTKIADNEPPVGWRKVFSRRYLLPSGGEKSYDIVDFNESVSIFAIDDNRNVILAKQFRPGPEQELMELPGGIVDPGEIPMLAATRELLEETGYIGCMSYLGWVWVSAYATGKKHMFLARRCRKIQEPRPDDSERITVILKPIEAVREDIENNHMVNATCVYRALWALGCLQHGAY